VYGEPEYLPVDEQHPIQPLDPYGASKHHVEHYLYIYRQALWFGFHHSALFRTSTAHGNGSYGEARPWVAIWAAQMLNGGRPIINGSGDKSAISSYVGDVARAKPPRPDARGRRDFITSARASAPPSNRLAYLKDITGSACAERHGEAKLGRGLRTFPCTADKAKAGLGWEAQVPCVKAGRNGALFQDPGPSQLEPRARVRAMR